MPNRWAGLTATPAVVAIAVCAAVIAVAIILIVRGYLKRRPTPEELERRRRVTIHQAGKMGDGEILDVEAASSSIVYSYTVAGVVYTASQDVSAVKSRLPEDLMTMVGPVCIKFDPRNPANSIVVCEDWSGLRNRLLKE
jgi:hypothetical protein